MQIKSVEKHKKGGIRNKYFLLSKRAKIIKFLINEGYSQADIALIFNIDRSGITRILQEEKNYKKGVKGLLSDKK